MIQQFRLRIRTFRSAYAITTVLAVVLFPGEATSQETKAPPPILVNPEDIVVVGRRQPRIRPEDVQDTLPSSTIKAYAADSIGELLDRLSARFRGGFSVLVNGRRLASTDAINALPPEALERIELLSNSASGQYGLGSGTVVLNLALRPRFQSTSLDIEGTGTTEGGGDTKTGAIRYSRIREDKRLNVALAYIRQSGLLESDRESSPYNDAAATLHSLVPRQNLVTLTSGYATPLGALNLDLSAEAGLVDSKTLTGPISNGAGGFDLSRQASDTQYIRSGATVSGSAGHLFWSLLLNGEASRTSVASARGPAVAITAGNIEQGTLLTALPDGTRSILRGAGFNATISGPLFTLPAGTVTFDASSGARTSSLTSILVGPLPSRETSPYKTGSAHGGVNVPIARRDSGWLGRLGDINLRGGIDYQTVSGLGSAWGVSSTLEWTPIPRVVVSGSRDTVPSLPSASQRYAPIVSRPGVLVYDAVAGQVVPVTVVTGGRDDLRKTQSSNSSVLVSYQGTTAFANINGSVAYTIGKVANPLLSFGTPSPFAQALFPSLFLRNTDGALLQFDARPFNGVAEITRQISTILHLSGPRAKSRFTSPNSGIISSIPPAPRLTWDVNLVYSYAVSHSLQLAMSGKTLDLLTTPLSLAGPGTARHHLGLQWTLANPQYGLNGSLAWDSRSRVRSINSTDSATTSYSALMKIRIESFVELNRSRNEESPRSLRLKASIDNILNSRIRVTGYPGLDSRSQRLLTDPYGRTYRLTIRKIF